MNNQAILIFKRNFLIYLRDKAYIGDIFFPFLILTFILSGKYSKSIILTTLGAQFLPLFLVTVSRGTVANLVYEKQSRQKEIQKIMGVTQFNYVLGWFLTNLFRFFLVLVPFLTILLITKGLDGDQGLLALSLILYAFAQFSLSYLLNVFFDDPRSAGDLAIFINLIGVFLSPISQLDYLQKNQWPNFLMTLIPAYGQGVISIYYGSQSLSLTKPKFGESDGYYMLGADIVIYFILYLYLDQIVRNEYGTQKSPLFIFGLGKKKRPAIMYNESQLMAIQEPLRNSFQEQPDISSAIYHEPLANADSYTRAIEIMGLQKSFKKLKAVNNISLSLYDGQILTLLGHNGAGKTTTISLLTGLITKDSGSIRVYGKSIDGEIDQIRKITGICPQIDVQYDNLTIEEHLQFYARVKGVPEYEITNQVEEVIVKCALDKERGKLSKNLSGGNRRKLSLGMAVIGGSRVIFLDEPTSGMDPVSRKTIWDILFQLKQEGKCLVLTTHHLDEAEVLSERIAVMARGKLLTVGSSNFVKRNFGIGYHLNVFNNGPEKEWDEKAQKIIDLVQREIPESKINPQSSPDCVSFSLTFDQKPKFSALFEKLEEDPQISIDIYMNTLEEAFINIGMDEDRFMQQTKRYSVALNSRGEERQIEIKPGNEYSDFSSIVPPACISKSPDYSFVGQWIGCFLRRQYGLKGRKLIFGFVLPITLVIVGAGVTLVSKDQSSSSWQTTASVLIGNTYLIAMSFLAGQAGLAPIIERFSKLKYALNVMGCRQLPYWAANLSFDYLLSFVIAVIEIICIFAFDIGFLQQFSLFLALALTGIGYMNISYLLSWIFNDPQSATKVFPLILIILFYLIPLGFFFAIPAVVIKYVLTFIFPSLPVSIVLLLQVQNDSKSSQNPLENMIQTPYFYIALQLAQGAVYFALTLSIDYRSLTASNNVTLILDENLDQDVIDERSRVEDQSNQDTVKAIKISKTYANGYVAVKGTSFGIEQGQVLGLLGPNGAGKSTTFNMLTARLKPSSGEIFLMGQPARKGNAALYQHVGICPQFDVVWKDITPVQHLRFFAYIKGLRGQDIDDAVNYFIKVMQLEAFVNTASNRLSGGNKRKLCTATALIGGTNMQFFDEPSSGVDPIARKFLWNTIQQGLKTQKGAIVLTTHTMDEAEYLCNKIAIQVNGQFACVGTPQRLKQRFGDGYRMTVDLFRQSDKLRVGQLVMDAFPQAEEIQEPVNDRLTFRLPATGFKFSATFRFCLEVLQNEQKLIKDFQINQATLEQVFMYFASRQQISPVAEPAKEQKKKIGLFNACFGIDEND